MPLIILAVALPVVLTLVVLYGRLRRAHRLLAKAQEFMYAVHYGEHEDRTAWARVLADEILVEIHGPARRA